MYRILCVALLGMCLGLSGCQELQNSVADEMTEETSSEVTARFCHIARIGSLMSMPEDVWDTPKSEVNKAEGENADTENTENQAESDSKMEAEVDSEKDSEKDSKVRKKKGSLKKEKNKKVKDDIDSAFDDEADEEVDELDMSSIEELQEATISQAVAEEVDADFLAIVESAAAEASTDAGIRASNQKEEELNLAIEMVQEDQAAEEESDTDEMEMDDSEENSTTMEILEVEEDSEESEDANVETTEVAEESEEVKSVKPAKTPSEERQMTAQMEEELERQAEACLKLLENTPKEVREEIKKANFQNVSYRLVKIPGSLIFGKTAPEYYLIRTMEYTGSSLTKDYQTLILSKNFSKWIQEQEKYLDIITLDEHHHEFWVEAPEFWNSSVVE